jgi:hypothetical protein
MWKITGWMKYDSLPAGQAALGWMKYDSLPAGQAGSARLDEIR